MRDCLLLVDVFGDFRHEDGDALLVSFRKRFAALRSLLHESRKERVPVVYANDPAGIFDGDARGIVERARSGPASTEMQELAPRRGDRFVVKPRYSAFDYTPLSLILEELRTERILLAGMSTEGCVAQTAIAAREEGYEVTLTADACASVDRTLEEIALAYLERVAGVRLTGIERRG